jgi:hypothetical protein
MDYGSYWLLDPHHGALVYGGEWGRGLDTIEEVLNDGTESARQHGRP